MPATVATPEPGMVLAGAGRDGDARRAAAQAHVGRMLQAPSGRTARLMRHAVRVDRLKTTRGRAAPADGARAAPAGGHRPGSRLSSHAAIVEERQPPRFG